MIRRIYIDNYKCFRNFEIKLSSLPCTMLIGPNGAGKSSLGEILWLFHSIGYGLSNLAEALKSSVKSGVMLSTNGGSSDVAKTRSDNGVLHLEIDIGDGDCVWQYAIMAQPEGDKFAVLRESLQVNERMLLLRSEGAFLNSAAVKFTVERNVLLLPFATDALGAVGEISRFKECLQRIQMVKPIPSRITSRVLARAGELKSDCSNLASWIVDLFARSPIAYQRFEDYLSLVMQDFGHVSVLPIASEGRILMVWFRTGDGNEEMGLPFESLSDGEKCQFVAAALLAANATMDNFTCFWDEPDNYITTSEIKYMMPALCHDFMKKGQLIVTSHSREAILTYGENEIIRLARSTHAQQTLPPVSIKSLREGGRLAGSLDVALESGKAVAHE